MPTVLVTGSSRGIGQGIALALAREGYNIVLNAPKASSALEESEAKVSAMGVKVCSVVCDIANTSEHQAFLEQASSCFDELVCLVNNAGVGVQQRGDLLDITEASFDEQINVNLRGTFFLTQSMARLWQANPSQAFRSLITISSSNAQAVSIERGEYCLAKSALSMMNKLFAVRLAQAGINCYEVRPGLIDTDMTRPVKARYDALLEQGFSPINRWGKVEDVAQVVTALAQGSMSFSTGESVHVDGGLLINRY